MAIHWEDKIQAFKTYRELYGNLQIRRDFKIPACDPRWPKNTWLFKLGIYASSVRSRAHVLSPERRAELNSLGFVWNCGRGASWSLKLLAFQQYLDLHGHLQIPVKFKVPPGSPDWPQETWGFNLGKCVDNIRSGADEITFEQSRQIDALGFVWKIHDLSWDIRMSALETYKNIYGDLLVPARFTIPTGNADWPKATWGMKLGSAVCHMRSVAHKMRRKRWEALEKIGFSWRSRRQMENHATIPPVESQPKETLASKRSLPSFNEVFGSFRGTLQSPEGKWPRYLTYEETSSSVSPIQA
jgi:hypothetical protein